MRIIPRQDRQPPTHWSEEWVEVKGSYGEMVGLYRHGNWGVIEVFPIMPNKSITEVFTTPEQAIAFLRR